MRIFSALRQTCVEYCSTFKNIVSISTTVYLQFIHRLHLLLLLYILLHDSNLLYFLEFEQFFPYRNHFELEVFKHLPLFNAANHDMTHYFAVFYFTKITTKSVIYTYIYIFNQ